MTGFKKYPLVFFVIITIPFIVASQNNYVVFRGQLPKRYLISWEMLRFYSFFEIRASGSQFAAIEPIPSL